MITPFLRTLTILFYQTLSIALCLALSSQSYAGPFTPQDLPNLVEKITPSAVYISLKMNAREAIRASGLGNYFQFFGIPEEQQAASGSGFIIDLEGHVLTNYHVVEQAVENPSTEILVTLKDKRQFGARIIGRDSKTDIALLKLVEKNGKSPVMVVPAKLGDSDKVRIGEPIVAIGNPFGLDYSVSAGIISSKNRNIGQGPFDNYFQTDAAINPGNSGGPMFNLQGEVVGINSAIYSNTGQFAGISFAIPINEVKEILPELKKFGRVPRPWLGILSRRLTKQLAYIYSLSRDQGILITNLVEDGPADEGGLKMGDIITEFNNTKVSEQFELERALSKLKPNEKATLNIVRGTHTLKVTLQLSELPPKLTRLREGVL